jgi:hypothetical protein
MTATFFENIKFAEELKIKMFANPKNVSLFACYRSGKPAVLI